MKKISILIILFGSSLLMTSMMTPKTQKLLVDGIELELAIPAKIADWQLVENNKLSVVNPIENTMLDKLYSQILERTYVNDRGQAIMLSIAYGVEQRRDMLAHFPEVCYPAQGFNVDRSEQNEMTLLGNKLKVKFLKTQKGSRKEDISYWVRVGDKVVSTRSDQKWHAILYGVQGIIPDGLIFRVSTIGVPNSQEVHQSFINALLNSVSNDTKQFLLANILTS